MRKITKVWLITSLLAVFGGCLLLFSACGSDPSYYGTYYSGTSTNSSVFTINDDGFYIGSPSNLYQTKYDYTYADGSIFLNSGIEFGLYENDQVLCINLLKDVGLADRFTVRDGHFDAMIRFMESYSVTSFIEFTADGSYAMTTVDPYSRETGTYTLNSGVLIYNKQMEVNSYGQASTMNEQHYAYIDSNYSFYAAAYVKNADQFSGNGTGGGNTNTSETPEPTHATYTLSYTATEGGRIVGSTSQTVSAGANGDSVMAIAEEGYEFIGWSDSVQSAERIDENVMADIAVTARFEKIPEYTLNYAAQAGGYIRGNTSQTVLRGEDGTSVTAVAEDGYEFIGWSDGVRNATRKEENVQSSDTITAQFRELDLPAFAGGTGTPEDPYQINTVRHLRNVEQYPAAHYVLTCNIALTGVGQGQSNFTPLFDDETMFTGTFDGNGYTISNLTIYNTDTFYTGLFACIGAEGSVHDLTLKDVKLQGTNYIGGVAGYALGAVTNCKVTGEITYLPQNTYGVFLGGITGRAENDLNGCTAEVTVTANEVSGTAYAGGIAGYCAYNMQSVGSAVTLVSRSAVTVTKTESKNFAVYAGGLDGYFGSGNNTLTNCYATGNVSGGSTAGGLVGYFGSGNNTLTSCYATGDVSGDEDAGGLVGCSLSDVTLIDCYATGDVSGRSAGGLVGYFSSGDNMLTNCYATGDVSGDEDAGGLVGEFDGSSNTLTNCYATGDVMTNAQSGFFIYCAGGLAGYFGSGNNTLTNCYATGNVSGGSIAGGLVGRFYSGSNTLTNCYATGDVSGDDTAGGLVGGFGSSNTLTNCYATGDVSGDSTAGGLVGYAQEVTLSNVHWLYFPDSGAEYAVGYSSTLGIPTNIGATKHTDIAEFYTLADTLNEGQETPAWEHAGANTLPTLIHE